MKNFTFQNTTKLIFGKGQIAKLAKELPKGKRILVTFGGGSVKKNGVYDQVKATLEGFDYIETTTKTFFKSLNLATEFEELNIGNDVLDEIVSRFKQRGTVLGENSNIDYAVVGNILK